MKQNVIGVRFERLIVLKQEGAYKNGTKLYLCQCDCGGTCQTSLPHLKRGEVKSCGCLGKESSSRNGKLGKINLTNQKFGRLLVLREESSSRYGAIWYCKCDCGNVASVLGTNLRKPDGTKSCGCLHLESLKEAGKKRRAQDPWEVEMYHYQSGAKQRNLDFLLSKDSFIKLISDVCFYCGAIPSIKCQAAALKEISFFRNGIDRKNPDIGYTLDNCVSCCWPCNEDKSDEPFDHFIQGIKNKYLFLQHKGLI